jgi:taurine dioxygenase
MDIEILPNHAGAALHGLDLSKSLSDSAFEDIYAAYLQHANILVSGQDHISPDDYVNFCGRFGEIMTGVPSTSRQSKYSSADVKEDVAPKYTLPGHPEIFVISNLERQGKPLGLSKAGLYWHSDLHYMAEPAKVTFLHGKTLPNAGGDTLILNTYEVFDSLPEELKARAKKVRAHHSWTTGWPYAFPTRAPLSSEERAATPDVDHPLIGRHPLTGREFFYPGALYDFDNPGLKLIGPGGKNDIVLFEALKQFTLSDRFIYRHQWQVGDILATDDLAGMHCATPFDDVAELRILHRVTIAGVAPLAA